MAAAQWGTTSVSWYGLAVFVLLAVKLGVSSTHLSVIASDTQEAELDHLQIVALVPVYNEDPAMLDRCLRSLQSQSARLAGVVVIDDGSNDGTCHAVAHGWAGSFHRAGIELDVIRFDENKGKREALAAGFRLWPAADAFLCVDSDTLLDTNALREVRKPFLNARTMGVTGLVLASNRRHNILTALIDLRYANAFLYERAAYSKAGSVLCACGSLSLYRGEVVRKYLDDFLSQTFLGRPAVFGDDRRLTNYALMEGRVVLQETAVAWTAVPERISHYLRQQIRWNKSFWRESVWVIRHMSVRKPAFWLTCLELTSWIVFTLSITTALVVQPLLTGKVLLGMYLIYLTLLSYARSVRYFQVPSMRSERFTRTEKLGVFLLAPLYGLIHLTMLLPLRLYSLATLRKGTWGTRKQVEVTLS